MHLPGDPGYDLARAPWNAQVDSFPAAVAYPAFPDEVADVLRAASAAGLEVAPQGTGHGAAPLGGRLGDAVLLRTAAMSELSIDPGRRIARVGAGVLWGDLADAAGTAGLAGLHPSSPDVGVVGYSIGGGIGWYARRLGLQCNASPRPRSSSPTAPSSAPPPTRTPSSSGGCAAAEALSASSRRLEFGLFAIDSAVAGLPRLGLDAGRAGPAGVGRLVRRGPGRRHDVVPAAAGARRSRRSRRSCAAARLVVIDGAVLGPTTGPPRCSRRCARSRPEFDTVRPGAGAVAGAAAPGARGPEPRLRQQHAADRPARRRRRRRHRGRRPAAPAARLTVAELRQLGGALAAPDPDGGALDCLSTASSSSLGLGLEDDPGDWPGLREDAARLLAALTPWTTGTAVPADARRPQRHAGRRSRPACYARLSALRRGRRPRPGSSSRQHA